MTDDILDLGGQAALVTGAGQGAGRAIALALAHQAITNNVANTNLYLFISSSVSCYEKIT